MEKKIALGKGLRDALFINEKRHVREVFLEELVGTVIHVGGPHAHLGIDLMQFEQLHHAHVVGDVPNVLALPPVAKEDAWFAPI